MINIYEVYETTIVNGKKDPSFFKDVFNTRKEALDYIQETNDRMDKFGRNPKIVRQHSIEKVDVNYANEICYSDVNPFEIVKVVSDNIIEVREMKAEELPWKKDFYHGGFFGHVANQKDQKWKITSNEDAPVYRAHKRKDGYFWSKSARKFRLANAPYKFHDYNF
jgi:hypothetical protein